MSRQGARERDPAVRVKEVLERGFADFYDAFADMDTNLDGKVSLQDFQQSIKQLEGGDALTSDQIDTVFNRCGVDHDGLIALKGFLDFFTGKDARSATDTEGIASGVIPRAFEEVLMECRDASNTQKFITVPSTMQWSDLRQKLKHKYGRAVNFMYEADGHTYTVKDERDFKLCWDSVDEAFLKSNPSTPSAHLQAFIIDIDPTKLSSSIRTGGLRAGRMSHLAPKKVSLGGAPDDRAAADRDSAAARRRIAQEDYEKKNQFIDDLMRQTGVSEVTPSNMRKVVKDLIKECQKLDKREQKTVSMTEFKKALGLVDADMTADQIAWYVKDVERSKCKTASGDINYQKYCTLKQTGKVVKEGEGLLNDEINKHSSRIARGLQDRYKTLQAAFKRMDEDKDGIISKQDFRQVLETKLKIMLERQYLDEIFMRVDTKQDGYLDYEEFLDYFRKVPTKMDAAVDVENMSDTDLCKLILQTFGNTYQVFQEFDPENTGYLTREKLFDGFQKAGIKISQQRVKQLESKMGDGGQQGRVDYLKFLKFVSQISQSDLDGSGVDEVAKEEARVRDKIREHYPDAKQAFHAFNTNKDGRLSEEEFFKGVDSVFAMHEAKPSTAMKNRLMLRADMDGDGFLAYHEFLARFGVKPVMRQAINLEKKISAALQKLFPESLQRAFDEMDKNHDRYIDKEDLKEGIKKVLKITNVEDAEMAALIEKLNLEENEKGLDFSAFLVRFGLDYRMDGKWIFQEEKKKVDSTDPEEVKLFKRSMLASKWYGRGGIKAVLLRHSVLGSMHRKWDTLKRKCSDYIEGQRLDIIKLSTFQDLMKGSSGVEPNITDIQWELFSREFLEKPEKEGGFKHSQSEILYAKLCDKLRDDNRSLAQLQIKEFSSALRDGLKMTSLSSDDVKLLAGQGTNKAWWNKKIQSVDVDKFEELFVQKLFQPELTLFRVLLVKNVWPDILRVLDSLNVAPHASRSMIKKHDFQGAFERLKALSIVSESEMKTILEKVEKDKLYETDGAFMGQLDYMKNFLMHYIPNEITLHKIVYPHWEDSAEKFKRFALSDKIELNYRQFKELCNQFSFARDMTATQIETLIDVMDEDGDGYVSLEEFKKRYARDEAAIMDAVRHNWFKLQQMFKKAKLPKNHAGRLDRPDFQHVLLDAQRQGLLGEAVTEDQIVIAVVGLEAKYVSEREVLWEDWLQKYAGDFFKVYQAFEGAHPTYKLPRWEVVHSCFEILQGSRQIGHTRMWRFLHSKTAQCPICDSKTCMWHKEFKAEDMVTWEEMRSVLERAGTDLEPRLLNKLLDDLDPQMHGFVHWRAFVEGRVPEQRRGKTAADTVWKFGEPSAGPYFLNGLVSMRLREVLVDQWSALLSMCTAKQREVTKEAREKAVKEQKEFKATPHGQLLLKNFEECLKSVLSLDKVLPPAEVTAGTDLPSDYAPPPVTQSQLADWIKKAQDIGKIAFGIKGEKPTEQYVDYVAFCRNYSQGDFNAERYIQRKWENIFTDLKEKEHPDNLKANQLDGLASLSDVQNSLSSPEMGLSEKMVQMLIKKYSEEELDDGEHGETEVEVNYIELCWQFAKKNIQSILANKCLSIFRQARTLDKTRAMKITNQEMHQVLRRPEIGLSECEAQIMRHQWFNKHKSRTPDDKKTWATLEFEYNELLLGKWEDLPCNPKLFSAWLALEKNWMAIASKLMASDAIVDGVMHIEDFKKHVIATKLDNLTDKAAVEQVGRDLGPDSRGYLKITDFMWAMSRPLIVEVLAPSAPQLLSAFKAKLNELRTEYLRYRSEQVSQANGVERGRDRIKVRTPQEIRSLQRAHEDSVLTRKLTEDTVWEFLRKLLDNNSAGAQTEQQTAATADTGPKAPKSSSGSKGAADAQAKGLDPLHVRILVERMDRDARSGDKGVSSAGTVSEESMLAVLQEFSHDQVFQEDLDLFQNSLKKMIYRALQGAKDTWNDPDTGEQVSIAKELNGICVHSKGVLSQVGRAPLKRQHMKPFFMDYDAKKFPKNMEPSPRMREIAQRRERDVYHSNPWKSFWQESARKVRMAHDGPAMHARPGQLSPEAVLAAAQDKVRKALFQRFDNITRAFENMDFHRQGVVSMQDLKKGIADLRIGLSTSEIDALIAAEGAGEFITYKDFLEKYSTPVDDLAKIAQDRARKGVYSRLRKDLSQQVSEQDQVQARLAQEEEDADRLAARAAAGLVALPASAGAQV